MSVHKEDDDPLFDDNEVNLVHITCQPSCIQGTMRPYQIEALSWLVNQYQLGVNSILADEMGDLSSSLSHTGLGKTLETISLLGFLLQYLGVTSSLPSPLTQRSAPDSGSSVDTGQLAERAPSLLSVDPRAAAARDEGGACGAAATRASGQARLGRGGDDVRDGDHREGDAESSVLGVGKRGEVECRFLVMDEAHRVKNENAKLSVVLRQFSFESRLLLTGTPLQVSDAGRVTREKPARAVGSAELPDAGSVRVAGDVR